MSQADPTSGVGYFFKGFELIKTKGLRRFVFVPLAVNLLLFAVAFYFLLQEIDSAILWLLDLIPNWLEWLKDWLAYFIWPLAVIIILVTFSFIFNSIANWIAAPFNGLLAEKVEQHLTGQPLNDEGLLAVIKDIPRTLGREWIKLVYYLPRAIGFLLIFFLLPVAGQLVWFLFTAWMMAIQYCDYPFDNHKVPFGRMRQSLADSKGSTFGFGIAVTLFAMVPIINFLVMPVAICGATAMWVDKFRGEMVGR
ncbi:sulfate transporter CysZ [Aliiglaciecola sp. CAU 1673]|uniref:sulfate transporter CysZ n=1 Tax=Aliiglaciecola sp. CAU 1673 TaxID=3032595 RepID=UPI0023D9AA18|nr:sulfate transporter CysZ [Aliiglaciecola sp. CAU 1673]MDF2177230.1 sulfate transporter CysZ [Aliiglaciecola sp. CAU 1673]